MSILFTDNAPVTFVHDTSYDDKPLAIFFDHTGCVTEIIFNRRVSSSEQMIQIANEILEECVFPSMAIVEFPKDKMPKSDTVPAPQPKAIHTSTIESSPPKNKFDIASTCTKCPNACDLVITASAEGQLLQVSGNRCPRGVEYAKEYIQERVNNPTN